MPAIVQLPQAPNTGLGMLGQMLLAGSSEYAQNRRQDDREARLRQERLADIEGERQYQDSRESRSHVRNRQEQLADIQSSRDWEQQRSEMALNLGLVREGYLAPDKIKDPEAIRAAFQAAARDGLVQRHPLVKEALAAGDVKDADLSDPSKLAAGLAVYSERAAKRSRFVEGQPEQATNRSNQLVTEREQLAQRASALEQRLSEPEPQPTPQEVAARALQLAQATKKPGQMPSAQEIAALQGQAQQEIAAQKAMAWNQQRQDALVQRSLINDRLRDVSAELNTLTNRFGVVGVGQPGATPPTTPAPQAATTQRMTPEQFAASVTSELAKRRPKTTGTNTPQTSLFENPTNNPVISAGNTEIQRRGQQQQQAELNAAIQEGQQIEEDLRATAAPKQTAGWAMGPTGLGVKMYDVTDPVQSAQKTSDLLRRKAANEARVRDLRAKLMGPVPAGASTPVVSTAVGSEPEPAQLGAEWWREP